jgi:hypothetical protein
VASSRHRPEGGAVDHHAVVEVGGVAGVGFTGGAFGVGRRGTSFGALGDVGDELAQLVAGADEVAVAALGGAGGLGVSAEAGALEVGERALQAGERGMQVVGQ